MKGYMMVSYIVAEVQSWRQSTEWIMNAHQYICNICYLWNPWTYTNLAASLLKTKLQKGCFLSHEMCYIGTFSMYHFIQEWLVATFVMWQLKQKFLQQYKLQWLQ